MLSKKYNMYWREMNCVLNDSLMKSCNSSKQSQSNFYVSEDSPPTFILPENITCKIYHPLTLNNTQADVIDDDTRIRIMDFIRINDCTESGNITELSPKTFDRILSTPCFIGVLLQSTPNHMTIIGTMFTLILHVSSGTHNFDFYTTYTTFLCIDKSLRDKGLAMGLIRNIMNEGYNRYGIKHGYYMTFNTHHSVHSAIESWYRPINIKNATTAGFVLDKFMRQGDRGNSNRQKIGYHIGKPKILPVKITKDDVSIEDSYKVVMKILCKGDIYLSPSLDEYKNLCVCFDVYIVNENSLFMLFPMDSIISLTGKRVRNAQLALMIGDILPQALWAASESKYDLLYGWCGGDITKEKIASVRGLITTAKSYLEFYNTKELIANNNMILPLF